MSEGSWVLKGVEPAVREKAVAEAERLGVSLSDYLTDVVLKSAIADQIGALREDEVTPSERDERAIFAPPPESPEGFAIRQRLKALERRLSTATSSLDGAVAALDTSLFDVTARVGEVEALAGDSAHALGQTQQELSNSVTGIQVHLAVIEDNITALAHVQDERATGIDHRIDDVELRMQNAERSITILADAHEALKHAVAEDFSALAHETTDRLSTGLADVRAAADAAAAQADAAVEHLVSELRGVREALEQRVAESAAETRARMHAAFADAAERLGALSDRVTENERFTARVTDQLRAQIVDVEDGAQTALDDAVSVLRDADAEQQAALETTRATLSAEIVAVREDQLSQLARLKLVDAAVGNTINELSEFREATERRMAEASADSRASLQRAHSEWTSRLDAQAERISAGERDVGKLRQTLLVEIERVESILAAQTDAIRQDVAAGAAATEHRIELAAQSFAEQLQLQSEHAARELAANVNMLREEHTGAMARLTLLDGALNRLEAAAAPMDQRLAKLEAERGAIDPALEQRLAQLEQAVANAETQQALAVIRDEVAALTTRMDAAAADTRIADRLEALQSQLDHQQAQAGELTDQLQGVARMLNRVAAQTVESAAKAEERAHQIELALADVRLSHLADAERTRPEEFVRAFEERVTAMEQRQTEALHALRNDIARFVADNDRRLADLEEPDTRDLAAEFDALRARIEERIIGVETRSIRTLEQVADTVSMIEQRFIQAGGDEAQRNTRSA